MKLHRLAALALSIALLGLGACQKSDKQEKVLATVNGQTITDAEFQQYLQLRPHREPITDAAQQKKVLDEMVDRVLIAQRAESNGIEKDPEVQGLLRRVRENVLVQSMIHKALKENPITDDEVKQRFDREVAATHKTEYLVRHILTKNEDEAKEVISQIQSKKANFATLAKQKSIDVQSGNNGGSLGWINQGMVVPEFFDSVTHLQKGAMSAAPVKTEFGWHVIKVEDTRPAKIPTFEEFMADRQAKSSFYRKLQDERIENLVKELRTKAKVEIKNQ
ncbi:MAG: peptidylprolyl isomerase [Sulfurifustis sp.]